MTLPDPSEFGPVLGDAYGELLQAYHETGDASEVVERDDGYVDGGTDAARYFERSAEWPPRIGLALSHAHGRVLDVGCGAGQHARYLQREGHPVVAMDASPGAVMVARNRGVETVIERDIADIGRFEPNSFDTVLLLGNNFGLVENADRAPAHLDGLDRLLTDGGSVIVETRNPHLTERSIHHSYHERNRRRDALPGRLIIRVRYERIATDWFEYLMVSPTEMDAILDGTPWRAETRYHEDEGPQYVSILRRS